MRKHAPGATLGWAGASLILGACHDPGPCFGFQQGATYTVNVVDRYDSSSPFLSMGTSYANGPNTCGPTLLLGAGSSFDVTVLEQESDHDLCLSSLVSVAPIPNVIFLPPFGGVPREETVFTAFTSAEVGTCQGTWQMETDSTDQDPETGADPFRRSIPGHTPEFVMEISFNTQNATADCVTAIPELGDPKYGGWCSDYYVVDISPK